jgi:hypothetical protein
MQFAALTPREVLRRRLISVFNATRRAESPPFF